MTIAHQAHRERIEAGLGFEWDRLPPQITRTSEADSAAGDICIRRVGASHKGVAELKAVRRIWASAVDQAFLEELSALEYLEVLHLDNVTAIDLMPLKALQNLKSLTVIGATKVKNLRWLPTGTSLRALRIEGMKAVSDLSQLADLQQLTALGVEGSMWTPMRVVSLLPLANLRALEYLFITNLRVEDKSLTPLRDLKHLKVLQCGRFFPRAAFIDLSRTHPTLSCDWLDEAQWT